MIGLVGMRRNNTSQITKAVTVAQLPEHHDKQLVPACEMLHVFVPFVFHYNSIKDSLWQELYELSEDIFSGVHRMTDLLLDCKELYKNDDRSTRYLSKECSVIMVGTVKSRRRCGCKEDYKRRMNYVSFQKNNFS